MPFRKTEVDRKLKCGVPVSMDEITETYLQTEQSPWGSVTPTPESMRKVVEMMGKASAAGLLMGDDGSPPPTDARDSAVHALGGEPMVAEVVGTDWGPMTPHGADIHIVMSQSTLAWSLVREPSAVGVMHFDQTTALDHVERGRFRFTSRNPEYADPSNPYGETDADLEFPDTDAGNGMLHKIAVRTHEVAPLFEPFRQRHERFGRLANLPVADWDSCPACGTTTADAQRVEHGLRCSSCRLCFTDPNTQPVVDEHDERAVLIATEPWRPLMETQVQYRDHLMVWSLRPQGSPGPLFVMAGELMEEVLDS